MTSTDQAIVAIENRRLVTELKEALDQQTATAEILQVINSSPGNLAPVFDAILEKALRLCEAAHGALYSYNGEFAESLALRGEQRVIDWIRERGRFRPTGPLAEVLGGEPFVQIADAQASEAHGLSPRYKTLVEIADIRTNLIVALRKHETVLGAVAIYRREVRAFSGRQIALLQNFAAQAVIAMENARLLDELRGRTGDLQEALEYQTATGDVLKAISRSAFDLEPVLDSVIETAARLCNAEAGHITRRDGEVYRVASTFALTPEWDALVRQITMRPGDGTLVGRTVLAREAVHIDDIAALPGHPTPEVATLGKLHTGLGVPLLHRGEPIGVISLARQRVEPFTKRQIELVRTFADQAVIAIENARLITETREALEQQTATAEVLQVINSSPGDLAPVFDAMLEKALRLCSAAFGVLWISDGDVISAAAIRGATPEFAEFLKHERVPFDADMLVASAVRDRVMIHVADITVSEPYRRGVPLAVVSADQAGIRTILMMPMAREDTGLGLFTIYRQEVRPFSEKEIALVENFAAQAVIAMENARLLTETREALEQQTATAEVLGVINSAPGDLAPVFDVILEKAHTLCGATNGALVIYDNGHFRAVATRGLSSRFRELYRQPFPPAASSPQ